MSYRLGIVTEDDPYGYYAFLRDEDPAHYSPVEDLWVISRFTDCLQAFADPVLWSSERRGNLINDLEDRRGRTLGTTDPPRHTANRRTISGAFTPQMIARLESRTQELAARLVADAIDRGPVDLVAVALTPYIAATLGDMFGVPRADFAMLRGWLAQLFERGRPVDGAEPPQVVASRQLRAYLAELAGELTAGPGIGSPADNLLTALLRAEVDGQRFGIDQVVATTMTFLAAGSESVSNLITNCLAALERHPLVRDRLRTAPDGVPAAVEEVMRWDSPTQGFVRTPTTVSGCTIGTFPPEPRSCSTSARPTGTRGPTTTPTASMSSGRPGAISASATARTTASGPPSVARWPASWSSRWWSKPVRGRSTTTGRPG